MSAVGIKLELQTPDLEELRQRIGNIFENPGKALILQDALTKALTPALQRLKNNTPLGPTGNLREAAAIKIVPYDKSGNAVGLLGYQRAGKGRSRSAAGGKVRKGPDRAFHQFWLEDGTNERVITKISNQPYARKSHARRMPSGVVATIRAHQVARGQGAVIASSYVRLGRFAIAQTPRQADGQRVLTTPPYPGAFFKKAKKGQAIRIAGMTPGGSRGRPPLATTWEQSRAEVADILAREIRISLEAALRSLIQSSTETVDA